MVAQVGARGACPACVLAPQRDARRSLQIATTGAMPVAPYGGDMIHRTDLAFRTLAWLSSVDEKEIPR
jgi:hypothetical protein